MALHARGDTDECVSCCELRLRLRELQMRQERQRQQEWQ
jgi:hypothetical protein